MAKLTSDSVLAIRERLTAGDPARVIAEAFFVTRGAISAIARRKTWSHI
jgi:hypothetical protein